MLSIYVLLAIVVGSNWHTAYAQIPVSSHQSPDSLLTATNPKLASNKRLVYDFYRIVLRGGQIESAEKFLSKDYIQHNPNIPTGRDALVKYLKSRQPKSHKPKPVPKTLDDVVAIVAEGDLVVISFVSRKQEMDLEYTTTWFDMFRIKDGLIVEHWDNALRSSP